MQKPFPAADEFGAVGLEAAVAVARNFDEHQAFAGLRGLRSYRCAGRSRGLVALPPALSHGALEEGPSEAEKPRSGLASGQRLMH